MFTHILVSLMLFKTAFCQINGEFWWLNEKFTQLQKIEPPQPKFEDISELETDESVKIVFKDNDLYYGEKTSKNNKDSLRDNKKISPFILYFKDDSELATPENLLNGMSITNNLTAYQEEKDMLSQKLSNKNSSSSKRNDDEFDFVFPDNSDFVWKNKLKNVTFITPPKVTNLTNQNTSKPIKSVLKNNVWFPEKKYTDTESICTFVSSRECSLGGGVIHMPWLHPKNIQFLSRICCIFPLSSLKPRNPNFLYPRYKRSHPADILSTALKQRNALLHRNSHAHHVISTTTGLPQKPVEKIVTPGDYVDPYWNIKNSKFRSLNKQPSINTGSKNTKFTGIPDYEDDYSVELPKPGLVGLRSHYEDRVTSWKLKTNKGFSYGGIDEESDEDDSENGFGYATIDPRLSNRKGTTLSKSVRRPPQRLVTSSNNNHGVETMESHTVRFHSTPDFHVMEGFKLVNIADNKNRFSRRTTAENVYSNEEELLVENTSPISNSDLDYDDIIDINQQVFKECGQNKIKSVTNADLGADNRCDPWLAVVVLTKNPENIICYATIVHPRAAVTAAECIHGKTTGEISVLAGVWNLKERTKSQNRMASVHTHPQFSATDLSNDLGILHWKRPLRLQANIFPACLADPHVGDDCYFVGWGGYDQPLHDKPKWQRATIITPRSCNEKISTPDVDLPADAFCASVDTRGTVTGVGGPLLCKGGDRVSVVGVAVYREDIVVLLPAYEWITSTLRELQIN